MQNVRDEHFPEYRLAGLLGGRYEITRLIAAGGMAEVYEARDTVLERRVAIKILHATFGADQEFVERFRREAMAAGRLNHPNIVTIYDWGRSDSGSVGAGTPGSGAWYMVMELVEGKTLRQILTERGTLPPAAAARIAEQVCRALEVARRAGIVHRDVKPENILVRSDGTVKVADFGVARALAETRSTQAGMVLGTASYLAPEQVEGHPGDHRSDLYALGIVLFEMLAGRPAFRGDNPVVVAYRRVAEDVPLLRDVRADAPPALEAIVARATERDPANRYENPDLMAAALAPLGAGANLDAELADADAVSGRTLAISLDDAATEVIRRRVKPKRRRKRLVLVLAILTLLAAVPIGVRAFVKVPVPDVVGRSQEAATVAIERAGLKAEPVLKHHATVAQGSVVSIAPAPNTRVRRGTEITLTISLGPALVTVPDVRNMTEADAVRTLTSRGLRPVKRLVFHPTVKKGVVFFQDPSPNLTLKEQTPVTISVSNGPQMVLVPSQVRKAADDATEALEALGFEVAIRRVENESIPRDYVVTTAPAGGEKAPKGSTITVYVSNGPTTFPAPDVRGQRYDDAKDDLERQGLKAARRQVPGSYGDTVVGQQPGPGKKVKRGDTIILYTA